MEMLLLEANRVLNPNTLEQVKSLKEMVDYPFNAFFLLSSRDSFMSDACSTSLPSTRLG
jgi:hypothetical protein